MRKVMTQVTIKRFINPLTNPFGELGRLILTFNREYLLPAPRLDLTYQLVVRLRANQDR